MMCYVKNMTYMHGVHFFSVHKSSFKVILIEARKNEKILEKLFNM